MVYSCKSANVIMSSTPCALVVCIDFSTRSAETVVSCNKKSSKQKISCVHCNLAMEHYLVFWITSINRSPTFYGMWSFCTMFTKTHNQILFWARWIQSTYSLLFLFKIHFNTIFPFTPRFSRWSLPSQFSHLNITYYISNPSHCA
jgi:hypothetical protein